MRARALCDQHAKVFEEPDDPANKTFFSEITTSISNARFARDGKYIVTRDYMTVRVWDVAMESRPLKTFSIHEHLRPSWRPLRERLHLRQVRRCFNHDASWLVTGSYQNLPPLSREGKQPDVSSRRREPACRASTAAASFRRARRCRWRATAWPPPSAPSSEPLDFEADLRNTFHPHQGRAAAAARAPLHSSRPRDARLVAENIIAVAATSTLLLGYEAPRRVADAICAIFIFA